MKKQIICILWITVLSCIAQGQDYDKLKIKADSAKKYCEANKLNTELCILVDMSIHSGKKRMFLWSFKQDTILGKGMCAHGCCKNGWAVDDTKSEPEFSNVPESHCSSLGKYKLGDRGWSSFGIHVNYKMHGLEKQNSNAFKRVIVLHSWSIMPDEETYPKGSPESWGCPAVSDNFMRFVDAELQKINGDVLLWIYN